MLVNSLGKGEVHSSILCGSTIASIVALIGVPVRAFVEIVDHGHEVEDRQAGSRCTEAA